LISNELTLIGSYPERFPIRTETIGSFKEAEYRSIN
jgi:hypothetical protein